MMVGIGCPNGAFVKLIKKFSSMVRGGFRRCEKNMTF
jgi:hypothetical protein